MSNSNKVQNFNLLFYFVPGKLQRIYVNAIYYYTKIYMYIYACVSKRYRYIIFSERLYGYDLRLSKKDLIGFWNVCVFSFNFIKGLQKLMFSKLSKHSHILGLRKVSWWNSWEHSSPSCGTSFCSRVNII